MKKILIVEDNLMNAYLLEHLLNDESKEYNFKIIIDKASNGILAVEKCKSETYDLILMDYHMPIMNGIEATEEIKKIDNFKNVPICFVSADNSDYLKDELKKIGINTFIDKPVSKKNINYLFENFII